MTFAEEDWPALLELASELRWAEAAKLVRSESGLPLREAAYIVENQVVRQFPESLAATSFRGRYEPMQCLRTPEAPDA